MKALKEKRVSLRSLFRRSLVILSLLALAFAFGACGDDDSGSNSGGNGGNGGYNPPEPVRLAKAISVIATPTGYSFQGCPPELVGTVLEVLWSDSATPVIVTDMSDFVTIPAYCDIPGKGDQAGLFRIASVYGGAVSGEFALPGVIPLLGTEISRQYDPVIGFTSPIPNTNDGLNLTVTGDTSWYSDKRPDYSKMVLMGDYAWHRDYPWLGSSADLFALSNNSPTSYTKKPIPITQDYPPFDTSQAPDKYGNWITLSIGLSNDKTGGKVAASPPDGLTTGSYTGSDYTRDNAVSRIKLSEYFEVSGVTVASVNWPVVFDDDTQLAGSWNADRTVFTKHPASETIPGSILALLKEAGITFEVTYMGGEKRVINLDEFIGNFEYASKKITENFIKTGGITGGTTTSGYNPADFQYIYVMNDGCNTGNSRMDANTILVLDQDNYQWNVVLQYVPREYDSLDTANVAAYINRVTIPVDVYSFEDQIAVAKNEKAGTNNIQTQYLSSTSTLPTGVTANASTTSTVTMSDDLLNAIKDKWVLTAQYMRGSTPATKILEFNKTMFYLGRLGAESRTSVAFATAGQGINLKATKTGWNATPSTVADTVASGPIVKEGTRRDWPLPLTYRRTRLTGEETVNIDVFRLQDNP